MVALETVKGVNIGKSIANSNGNLEFRCVVVFVQRGCWEAPKAFQSGTVAQRLDKSGVFNKRLFIMCRPHILNADPLSQLLAP